MVAFAEADEHKTAREMIAEDYRRNRVTRKIALLEQRCREAGIAVDFSSAAIDVVSAIKNILKQNTHIDMVLLSPTVTTDGAIKTRS
ncbi:MAG: hypothetical protein U0411_00030 [Thermodesulfovibrionales bacterium]